MARRSDKRRTQRREREIINGTVTLDKEQWETVANELLDAGPLIQEALIGAMNDAAKDQWDAEVKNHPAIDPTTFEDDIRLACTAIRYVANFAADKCRFIVMKEGENDGKLN